jgi:hypothetical protein
MNKINGIISEAEGWLSDFAAIPVFGTLAGTAKVIGGIAQTLIAVCGILFGSALFYIHRNPLIIKHSWTHIQHGLSNVVMGMLEAIPGIGTALYLLRLHDIGKETIFFMHYPGL